MFSKFFLNAVFPTSEKKLKHIFSSLRKTPPPPQMTSTTNENNYFPEPAWDNIKAFMMPEKHELPLFPHPTAWALTESGLNWYAPHGKIFYHDEERFFKKADPMFGEHPDIHIQTQRVVALENWLYDTTKCDDCCDEIGFGADPELQDGIESLWMTSGL